MRARPYFPAVPGIVLAAVWSAACGSGSDTIATPSLDAAGVTIQGTATSSDRDDREFTGRVESVTPPTLVVSGVTVLTTDETEIKRGGLEVALTDIAVGESVKVEGAPQPDGSVIAREIKVAAAGDDDDDEDQGGAIEFSGSVSSITPPSLVVAGRTVLTNADTEFKGKGRIHSLADLNVGDEVEVEGLESSPGLVLAFEIQRLEEAGDDDDEDEDDDDEDEDDDDDEEEDEDDDDDSGHGS
jgi:hypothetical protein